MAFSWFQVMPIEDAGTSSNMGGGLGVVASSRTAPAPARPSTCRRVSFIWRSLDMDAGLLLLRFRVQSRDGGAFPISIFLALQAVIDGGERDMRLGEFRGFLHDGFELLA